MQAIDGANSNLFSLQRPERGESFVPSEEYLDPRERLIEWWRNAPEQVIQYSGGTVTDSSGNTYEYPVGWRLLIGDAGEEKQVMDTCETPWAFATVDKAFAELAQKSGPVKVLERGFGMGITARKVIQNLITRGGEYTVIELNRGNANYARDWIRRQKIGLTNLASGLPGTKPVIDIALIEGEAYEETAKLAQEHRKFDVIVSDTYPLNEDEQGVNDLQDLDTLKRCLEPGGVFTFFAYFPGSTGGVVKKQENMIVRHFRDYILSSVPIFPPSDYEYLQTDGGPVRSLPIVICKTPIF